MATNYSNYTKSQYDNQKAYLDNLISSGSSGQASWAKKELDTLNSQYKPDTTGGTNYSNYNENQYNNQKSYLTNLINTGSSGQSNWAKNELANLNLQYKPTTNTEVNTNNINNLSSILANYGYTNDNYGKVKYVDSLLNSIGTTDSAGKTVTQDDVVKYLNGLGFTVTPSSNGGDALVVSDGKDLNQWYLMNGSGYTRGNGGWSYNIGDGKDINGYNPNVYILPNYITETLETTKLSPEDNQRLYLENLINSGTSGQAAWAKAELEKMNNTPTSKGTTGGTNYSNYDERQYNNQKAYLENLIANGTEGQKNWAKAELNALNSQYRPNTNSKLEEQKAAMLELINMYNELLNTKPENVVNYENQLNGLLNELQNFKYLDPMTIEEALARGQATLGGNYDQSLNNIIDEYNKNAIARGMFGQTPVEALKQNAIAANELNRANSIYDYANNLRNSDIAEKQQIGNNELNLLKSRYDITGDLYNIANDQWQQDRNTAMYAIEQYAIEEQKKLDDALTRLDLLGYADEKVAQVLGVPVGTPSNDERVAKAELDRQKELLAYQQDLEKNMVDYKASVDKNLAAYKNSLNTPVGGGNGNVEIPWEDLRKIAIDEMETAYKNGADVVINQESIEAYAKYLANQIYGWADDDSAKIYYSDDYLQEDTGNKNTTGPVTPFTSGKTIEDYRDYNYWLNLANGIY